MVWYLWSYFKYKIINIFVIWYLWSYSKHKISWQFGINIVHYNLDFLRSSIYIRHHIIYGIVGYKNEYINSHNFICMIILKKEYVQVFERCILPNVFHTLF